MEKWQTWHNVDIDILPQDIRIGFGDDDCNKILFISVSSYNWDVTNDKLILIVR